MGYMRHHAVLVTSWDDEALTRVRAFAINLAEMEGVPADVVSEISPATTNGYRSFVVFPDGSKEGWMASDNGDRFRAELIRHLDDKERYSDRSSVFDWCLVQYGDDNHDNRMLRHEADRNGTEAVTDPTDGPES